MMTGYMAPKISVKDSFDDDEGSDDIEDEVFIRDGRKGFKLDDEMGVKRPLMAPRRKCKSSGFYPEPNKRNYYRRHCAPYCYGVVAVGVILGSLLGATLFVNLFPSPLLYKLRLWSLENRMNPLTVVPCIDYSTEKLWHVSFPQLRSEAALVMVDLNHDNVDDVVVGFAASDLVQTSGSCVDWPDAKEVCGGGILALNGKSGKLLWRYWTRKDILFVDCSSNLNADSTKDCLISGKGGVLCAIDGKTGTLIWELTKSTIPNLIDIYSAQYIADLDGDGFAEILMAHTSDQTGHLIILSGRGGELLGQFRVPDSEGLFTAPRILVSKDGTYMVIFASGAYDTPGAIYSVPLSSIAKSLTENSGVRKIWDGPTGVGSGFVLVDLTGDGYDDIIITVGATLVVLNSYNYSVHWNVSSYGGAEPDRKQQIIVGPTPAYFDDDYYPDILITHSIGPSFPTHYYSQTWVASGKNGEQLLREPLIGTSEMTAPGISISFTGQGNDMFLFWMSTCNTTPEELKTRFSFQRGSTILERTQADLCKLRFNKTLELQLLALNQHIQPPGFQLYSSRAYWELEHNNTNVPLYKEHPQLEWSEGGSEPFDQVAIKKPLTFAREGVENYPQYADAVSSERRLNEMFPINVNLGDSAIDYNIQEPGMRESKLANDMEGRNERRTVRSLADGGARSLPKASSTATLANPLNGDGIDVVFATHWITPKGNVRIITDKQEDCIKEQMENVKKTANINEMDLEFIEENAARECLRPNQENYEDSDDGQLTVYRFGLKCKCSNIKSGEVCSTPLPMNQQSFSHHGADVYFKSRY